ncbi:MAG: hypothetical protein ACRC41_15775, partial [Sarcina sp.]
DLGFQMDVAQDDIEKGATAGAPGDGVSLEIIQGTIETQQVRNLSEILRKCICIFLFKKKKLQDRREPQGDGGGGHQFI